MPKSTTPKAILNALFPNPVTVAGIKLQPVTSLHYLALEKLENPLINAGLDANTSSTVEALLILSLTPVQVRELLAEEYYAITVRVQELAGRIPAAELPGITQEMTEHILSAFKTAVPASAKECEARPLAPGSSSVPSMSG